MTSRHGRKRNRATVVLQRNGLTLLVREHGVRSYSLPGGGIERRESVLEAAIREIREETGLTVVQAEYLFDHEGRVVMHNVVQARARGRVRLQRRELDAYLWWNGHDDVPMLPSASAIVERVMSL